MNSKGFTLLELIVTLVIFAVLSGLAFFGSAGMRETIALKGAARQVYSDMQQARLKAIKEGKLLKVDFNGTSGEYDLVVVDKDDNPLAIVKNRDLNNDYPSVKINCTPTDVTFKPNGTTDTNGGIYIAVNNISKRVYVRSNGTGAIVIRDQICP